jgi:hypothetical protein
MASTSVTIMVDPRGVVPTPDHVDYATWQALPKELRGAYLQRSLAIAREDGEKAENDVAFWERTYRITKGVATFGLSEAWDALTAKLRQYRADRQAAAASVSAMDSIANDPKYAGKLSPNWLPLIPACSRLSDPSATSLTPGKKLDSERSRPQSSPSALLPLASLWSRCRQPSSSSPRSKTVPMLAPMPSSKHAKRSTVKTLSREK